jgi:glycosyltransferase involved in cell wall biosynthesis
MDPLVSVLIASYNAGEYLKPSLMSIFEQSYKRLEVILIDDGSTDGSIESITGLTDVRLQIIRQPNCGKPCALNAALDIMSGELFAIHDADDLSHPLRIERQVSRLMAEPDLAAVFCGHELRLPS